MAKKNIEDLPKQIYVVREPDGDDESYLIVWEDINGIDNRTVVGTYELVSTGRVAVSRSIV